MLSPEALKAGTRDKRSALHKAAATSATTTTTAASATTESCTRHAVISGKWQKHIAYLQALSPAVLHVCVYLYAHACAPSRTCSLSSCVHLSMLTRHRADEAVPTAIAATIVQLETGRTKLGYARLVHTLQLV